MKNFFSIAGFLLIPVCFSFSQVTLRAGKLRMLIDAKGQVKELGYADSKTNFIHGDTASPILTLVKDKIRHQPSGIQYAPLKKNLSVRFAEAGVLINIKVEEKKTHLALEILRAEPAAAVEAVVWGPLPLTINKKTGEVIGVVREDGTAIGMTVLNIKTLGGAYPNSEGTAAGRGEAATVKSWGSTIQAYSINRDRFRRVDAWNGVHKNMPVSPVKGESVVGSKIALFACPEEATLDQIEAIGKTEGLPHPEINHVWIKRSAIYGKSYLISSFSEDQVDEMIAYTKRAGLISLYHEGPFATWGHYQLNTSMFPSGNAGMKKAVEKARAAGLFLGVHTLSNFINTNDAYVSPVPDDRLSLTGYSVLVKNIDDTTTTVEVQSPEYFSAEENNNLHTVKIGKELIRYKSVSNSAPFVLRDCLRGAFGTKASSHSSGDTVGKLFDHGYLVFFPNLDLQREISRNLATFFNETGVNHFDFDGHEGGLASGHGDYGIELFSKDVTDNIRHDFIVGTSNSRTFYWNIGSYYNWGEPWYGGFKESMEEYRIRNQEFFDRNLMPRMLGWYLLTENTSLADMEWMLARAAGYEAGFAMVARPAGLKKNPIAGELLDAIREWETARNANAFSVAQKERLKSPKNEFHLEKLGDGKWNLYQYVSSPVFTHTKTELQPGEPTHAKWKLEQSQDSKPLLFRINVTGSESSISNLRMVVDSYAEINIPVEVLAGESLISEGNRTVVVVDKTGRRKKSYELSAPMPVLDRGSHTIIFDAQFNGTEPPKVEAQFKYMGEKEAVGNGVLKSVPTP